MSTNVNVDQELALVVAPGSPKVASDQALAMIIEQRLSPQVIYTRCDQLVGLVVLRRSPTGSLAASPLTLVGNGVAQATITATVVDSSSGAPVSGVTVTLNQNGHSTISPTSGVTNSQGQVTLTATDTNCELVTYAASGVTFTNSVSIQFTASRVDGTVYNQRGHVIAGAQVYVLEQPATLTLPPKSLQPIFADVLGQTPITQPLSTNGLGQYNFYSSNDIFTLMIVNNGAISQVYEDQEVGKPTAILHSLEWWVKSNCGPAFPGAQIFVVSNNYPNVPATLKNGPPSPLIPLFADSVGSALTQPLLTDGFGYAKGYAVAGVYTVLVYFGGLLQQIYPDQSVGGVYAGRGLGRYDTWIRTCHGVSVPNARVIVSAQPCSIPGALVPEFPTNLAAIFQDANGVFPINQSLTYDSNGNPVIQSATTDALGHAAFYTQPNQPFTVSVYSPKNVLMYSLSDQVL